MGASCTCATECAIVWWFQCHLLKYRETDRYREIAVTRVIQLWAASAVALLAGGYTEHCITTTSLKRIEQIVKSIFQGTAGNHVILSCQVSLKNATCVTCLCVFFCFCFFFPVLIRACSQIQLSLQICTFWSPTTLLQHSLFPLTEKKPFESILARSVFRTLASGSSDMYRMEYFAVAIVTCMLLPECEDLTVAHSQGTWITDAMM